MTLLKPSSIASFSAAKLLTIAKKWNPPVIVIDAEVGPDVAVIVADNQSTEKGSCLVDVVFVVDGEDAMRSFHVVANPDDAT